MKGPWSTTFGDRGIPPGSRARTCCAGRRTFLSLGVAAATSFLGWSCLPGATHRYLGVIYGEAARRHGPDRNPIVVIPILMGTPNGGSALGADQLLNGWHPAPFLREFSPALLATMPSLYELLPRSDEAKVLPGVVHEERSRPGDGTVTRDSALRSKADVSGASLYSSSVDWPHPTFIAADHLGLTSDSTFIDNVLHLLLET